MMVGWEATMNSAIKKGLDDFGAALLAEVMAANGRIGRLLLQRGLQGSTVQSTTGQAVRAAGTAVSEAMRAAAEFATATQREINRELLPQIQQRMQPGYQAAQTVERGNGVFERIKGAVNRHADGAVSAMFGEATAGMLQSISKLVADLEARVRVLCAAVSSRLAQVYSVVWENAGAAVDPARELQIKQARDDAAHRLQPLRARLDAAMQEAGLERAQPDVEITDVMGASQRRDDAERAGAVIDITSDSEDGLVFAPNKKPKTE